MGALDDKHKSVDGSPRVPHANRAEIALEELEQILQCKIIDERHRAAVTHRLLTSDANDSDARLGASILKLCASIYMQHHLTAGTPIYIRAIGRDFICKEVKVHAQIDRQCESEDAPSLRKLPHVVQTNLINRFFLGVVRGHPSGEHELTRALDPVFGSIVGNVAPTEEDFVKMVSSQIVTRPRNRYINRVEALRSLGYSPSYLSDPLGYEFADPRLLLAALSPKYREEGVVPFSDLEFLGDAALDFASRNICSRRLGDIHARTAKVRIDLLPTTVFLSYLGETILGIDAYLENSWKGVEIDKFKARADSVEAILGGLLIEGGLKRVEEVLERVMPIDDLFTDDDRFRMFHSLVMDYGKDRPKRQSYPEFFKEV